MDEKTMKQIITDALNAKMSDRLPNIVERCAREEQLPSLEYLPDRKPRGRRMSILRYTATAAMLVLMFTVGLLFGNITDIFPEEETPPPTAVASVCLDVNPSIALSIDENGTVIGASAQNEDAESILSHLSLKGLPFETAVYTAVGALYMKGYLKTEANSVLVSVDALTDSALEEGFLAGITSDVKEVFDLAALPCTILTQTAADDETILSLAEENGVSVGKMTLIYKLVGLFDELSDADIAKLSALSISELTAMYGSVSAEKLPGIGDIVSGILTDSYISEQTATAAALEALGISEDSYYTTVFLTYPENAEDGFRMIHSVTVACVLPPSVKTVKIDAVTGEIIEIRSDDSLADFIPS